MRKNFSYLVAGACLLCFSSAGTAAFAQGNEYAPKGLPLGAFRAFPTAYAGIMYDTNIYRQNNGSVGDSVYNFGGELLIQSNWSQHMLNLRGTVNSLQYNNRSNEDRTSFTVGANARVDIQRGSNLALGATHTRQFEGRNNPNTGASLRSPLQYDTSNFTAALKYMPTTIGVEVGGNYTIYDFSNARLNGGGFQNNRDRDHDQYEVYGKVSYAASPGYAAFVQGSYNEHLFDLRFDRTGVNRDSSGYAVDAGVDLEVTAQVQGHVYVGYFSQNYRTPLSDVDGFHFGGAIDWFPTNLITMHFVASHELVDTTLAGASTSAQSQIGVDADYELLRNLRLNAGANYVFADFDGTNREDSYLELVGGVKYFMNQYISAGASYRYYQRSSSFNGQDYDGSIVSGSVNLHL
jgi:hypothetical protein